MHPFRFVRDFIGVDMAWKYKSQCTDFIELNLDSRVQNPL